MAIRVNLLADCKSLVESDLGCNSDGVRAKGLVVKGLLKEKGREKEEKALVGEWHGVAERQLCLQSLHNLPLIWLLLRGLGLDSDGVRAKILDMRWLWI